jgi:dTMP kinase
MTQPSNQQVSNRRHRGLLVAIEGLDGSGKTTQAQLLFDWFQAKGIQTHLFSLFKSRLLAEQMTRLTEKNSITTREACLMTSAELAGRVEYLTLPFIEAGAVVIWDKYLLGCRARDVARGIDDDTLDALFDPLPHPDVLVFLDIDPAIALARKRPRERPTFFESGLDVILGLSVQEAKNRYRSNQLRESDIDSCFLEFQHRVSMAYKDKLARVPYVRVDATISTYLICGQIRDILALCLGTCKDLRCRN